MQAKQKIYLWYFYIDKLLSKYKKFYDALLPSEKVRASRFIFERDRQRFVISHGVLKELLIKHFSIQTIARYEYNEFGKPFLPNRLFSFNLSHSKNVGACILGCKVELGIDVEYLCKINWRNISTNILSKKETSCINNLKERSTQQSAFTSMWTQKESVAKALGCGFSIPFTNITSSPYLGKHISFTKKNNIIERWFVYKFLLDNCYFISAACSHGNITLCFNELM